MIQIKKSGHEGKSLNDSISSFYKSKISKISKNNEHRNDLYKNDFDNFSYKC